MTGREVVNFGDFRFDAATGEFWKRGIRIRLRPQLANVLSILVRHPGEIIPKDVFRREIWGEFVHVDFEQALANAACELRRLLDDEADNPRFLEVVPRRGIRFLSEIESDAGRSADRGCDGEIQPSLDPPSFSSPATLAVLAFEDLSDDSAHSHFGLGLNDEVVSQLAKIEWLRVMSHSATRRFEHSRRAPAELARLMGVAFVLEGSYLCEATRIRVNARLADAESDVYVWAASYEREWHKPIALQHDIARRIVRAVGAVVEKTHARNAPPSPAPACERTGDERWSEPTQWGDDFRGAKKGLR